MNQNSQQFCNSLDYSEAEINLKYLEISDMFDIVTSPNTPEHCLHAIINNTCSIRVIWVILEFMGNYADYDVLKNFILQNEKVYWHVMNDTSSIKFSHTDFITQFKHNENQFSFPIR